MNGMFRPTWISIRIVIVHPWDRVVREYLSPIKITKHSMNDYTIHFLSQEFRLQRKDSKVH